MQRIPCEQHNKTLSTLLKPLKRPFRYEVLHSTLLMQATQRLHNSLQPAVFYYRDQVFYCNSFANKTPAQNMSIKGTAGFVCFLSEA